MPWRGFGLHYDGFGLNSPSGGEFVSRQTVKGNDGFHTNRK